MPAKLLLETLRMADGGRVVCDVAVPDGAVVQSVIEKSFFEEFAAVSVPNLTTQKKARIVNDNVAYLEAEADRQWHAGMRELVIR